MKTLRLAVPLVLAAFMLTCQGDQPTAPDNADSRATFKKGKPPPGPSTKLDYYVEQVRARLSQSGELSVRVAYKNASTVSCGESSRVPLEVTTILLDDLIELPPPPPRTFFCGAPVCDEPGGGGATFRCSDNVSEFDPPGVYEIRAELKDGVDSKDPNRDNFGYFYVEIP